MSISLIEIELLHQRCILRDGASCGESRRIVLSTACLVVSTAAPATKFTTIVTTKQSMSSSFILAARRTPVGKLLGSLSTVPAPQLAAAAIRAALTDSGL